MKLKLLFVLTIILTISFNAMAQVGINTIEPTADLEIVADASPMTGKYNGIIIPKVDALPVTGDATFPTAAQAGLLVYLNPSATPDGTEGIYMFDGSQYIKLEPASASGAFYDNGTTNFATTTTSNVQRTGKVSVGSSLSTGKFNVDVVSANNSADPIAIKVENNNTGTGSVNTYSAYLENKSTVGGTGIKYGIRSEVSSAGNSDRVGIYNNVISSGSAARGVIGINNVVGGTSGTTAINIGIRSEIGTPASDANSFGIYSIARGNDLRNNYSGWFQGDKFAIKNEDNSDGYEMPTISGNAGQVLMTNGTDVAAWTDLPAANSSPVFYGEGTLNSATNTTDAIERSGSILLNMDANVSPTVLSLNNSNPGTGSGNRFTIDAINNASASGSKYGIRNRVSADGAGSHFGIDNDVQISAADQVNYGIRNNMGVTVGAASTNYGIYTEAGNSGGEGTIYSIYSLAQNNGSEPAYSGYFRGDRFAIKNEDDSDGYEMPTISGTAGQVLTTDGAGVATWKGGFVSSRNILSANQILGSADTWIKLNMNNSVINAGNGYNSTTNRFESSEAGIFKVNAQFHSTNSYGNDIFTGISIFVNGVIYAEHSVNHHNNGQLYRNVTATVDLPANGFIEIFARSSDSNFEIDGSGVKTYFEVQRLF
ncbi:hypothetical protein [Nonlabens sp. YIK11]|uniref:hypothetical protein n=1 Tax=Nonlabens sp. YIK11 TaxID=1453349 RepID=UPI000AA14424|nr:hypothetical protein [Nonlabens sp. YIK11]